MIKSDMALIDLKNGPKSNSKSFIYIQELLKPTLHK
jgi:hypothetical protein